MPVTCFNLRDVVSCQYTDLAFLLAVLVNFVYLLLINSYYYYYYTAAAAVCRDVRIYDAGATEATTVLATWSELIATTLRSVDRLVFYGTPPKELLSMFSVWPTDILVLLMGGEAYAQDWVPDPIHLWARMEEGNMALLHLPHYDAAYPHIEAFADNDNVILIAPPSDCAMMSPPPPSYVEATSTVTTQRPSTATLISDSDESEDDGDDDVFVI